MRKKTRTAALAALAVMMTLAAACGSGDGDGDRTEDRISAGDWNRFIGRQVDKVARGEQLDPAVHDLFCDGRRDLNELGLGEEGRYASRINRREQAQIMAYCAGVERLIKK